MAHSSRYTATLDDFGPANELPFPKFGYNIYYIRTMHLLFKQDVKSYLEARNKDMMIFKCKKVVMVQWLHSVVPYIGKSSRYTSSMTHHQCQ